MAAREQLPGVIKMRIIKNRVPIFCIAAAAWASPASPPLALGALKDQACAGALLWVWVTFGYLFPAAASTLGLLSPEKRFVEKQVV
jgi:hypothetical protein